MDVDSEGEKELNDDKDAYDGDTKKPASRSDGDESLKLDACCTRAEPFAIADPALGKVDANFDASKVPMLTLQFDIEKASTGFCQSACLEPIASALEEEDEEQEDEKSFVSLQHSLFCAKLFQSIRRELAPDTEDVGQIRTSAKAQSAVWLSSSESEDNFLPPLSAMMKSGGGGTADGDNSNNSSGGLEPLAVVHVHEGDVKVLLDCEYALRVRLVEASSGEKDKGTMAPPESQTDSTVSNNNNSGSGSQSPALLRTVCRALLLHAQEKHHQHSVETEAKLQKQQRDDEAKLAQLQQQNPNIKSLPPSKKGAALASPRILQSCVSLGTKMLFERRIRKILRSVHGWIQGQTSSLNGEGLVVEWLALSVFDLSAQFSVSFGATWSIDVHMVGDELTVTSFGDQGDYRKVKFHTDWEFELYLKTALRRVLRRTNDAAQQI